jgi:hypothetical protein
MWNITLRYKSLSQSFLFSIPIIFFTSIIQSATFQSLIRVGLNTAQASHYMVLETCKNSLSTYISSSEIIDIVKNYIAPSKKTCSSENYYASYRLNQDRQHVITIIRKNRSSRTIIIPHPIRALTISPDERFISLAYQRVKNSQKKPRNVLHAYIQLMVRTLPIETIYSKQFHEHTIDTVDLSRGEFAKFFLENFYYTSTGLLSCNYFKCFSKQTRDTKKLLKERPLTYEIQPQLGFQGTQQSECIIA